jgi:hypothetical protein
LSLGFTKTATHAGISSGLVVATGNFFPPDSNLTVEN